tara:strand:- start:410 stop:757 length:348 start_codon:yes stop_codon:yes gene_type:complete
MIQKNKNVKRLSQTSKHFQNMTRNELKKRHEMKLDAVDNALQMYINVIKHYNIKQYDSNNIGKVQTINYWTLNPKQHAKLLKDGNNINNNARNRRIRKYPAVYRKARNRAAHTYL